MWPKLRPSWRYDRNNRLATGDPVPPQVGGSGRRGSASDGAAGASRARPAKLRSPADNLRRHNFVPVDVFPLARGLLDTIMTARAALASLRSEQGSAEEVTRQWRQDWMGS